MLAVSVLLAAVILTWHRSVQDGYIKKKGHEHHFKERRASTPIMEPVLVVRDWWQSKRAKNEQEHELIPSEPPRYSQEYGDRKGGVA